MLLGPGWANAPAQHGGEPTGVFAGRSEGAEGSGLLGGDLDPWDGVGAVVADLVHERGLDGEGGAHGQGHLSDIDVPQLCALQGPEGPEALGSFDYEAGSEHWACQKEGDQTGSGL